MRILSTMMIGLALCLVAPAMAASKRPSAMASMDRAVDIDNAAVAA